MTYQNRLPKNLLRNWFFQNVPLPMTGVGAPEYRPNDGGLQTMSNGQNIDCEVK
jgi:hypothetical protein